MIKYRTWCGLCAICERMYGRFAPRDKDPPDGVISNCLWYLHAILRSINILCQHLYFFTDGVKRFHYDRNKTFPIEGSQWSDRNTKYNKSTIEMF